MTTNDTRTDFTDAEWREYQNIPEQGYSHRHWLNERNRRVQERAEELAKATEKYNSTDGPRVHPRVVSSLERAAFADGFLARDADPTTVTAEQIEAAERRGAVKALKDAAMSVNLLVSTGIDLSPEELDLIDACASGAAQGWLMAQAARIEGDEA